jgi:hypothetical protein
LFKPAQFGSRNTEDQNTVYSIEIEHSIPEKFERHPVTGTIKMNDFQPKSENFFEKFGLEVSTGVVEQGKTYPIYGMITKFFNDTPGEVEVELNFKIRAKMTIPDASKVETLKQRSFEPGIFVGTVIQNDEELVVDCTTVIFGKKINHQA